MSTYDYSDRAKPASAHTKAVNAQLAHDLRPRGASWSRRARVLCARQRIL